MAPRGGANSSSRRRRLLYVTFGVPHCLPEGSTYSILDEYVGRLRLRDLDSWASAAPAELAWSASRRPSSSDEGARVV